MKQAKLYKVLKSLKNDGLEQTLIKIKYNLKQAKRPKNTSKIDLQSPIKQLQKKHLTIAMAVTDAGENVPEGDFFTASELGSEFEKFGWNVVYLSRKKDEWHSIPQSADVLISFIHDYDALSAAQRNPSLITIAWARNWFDRWVKHPSFNSYDLVFASSQIACDYINEHSNQKANLLPIAANAAKFDNAKTELVEKYKCDYCFTGSYWGAQREIIDFIDPKRLPEYKFHIYGKNWDKIEKFKVYDCGFLPYNQMPLVYANSKIVIDDANHVTKPYGSVNSRVFDALASGTLVVTNGILGSELTFDGKLPSFSTQEELYKLLEHYLSDEDARLQKVEELRDIVLSQHTYKHRAMQIKEVLKTNYNRASIAIKIPAPRWDVVHEWGDYHFGLALKKEFEKLNYRVLLQVLNEWDNDAGRECDIALVLRGLSRYTIKPEQINIMWNISHPDKVSIEEYNEYDYVFIASKIWSDEIAKQATTSVETMYQCTDIDLFKPFEEKNKTYENELLFVGNSRKVFRKVLKDVLPTKHSLSVYGSLWDGIIDRSCIKGVHIENQELYKYYASAKILLNDHWDDMRLKGFVSNRIFDALASGAFIVSDNIVGIDEILCDSVVTYEGKKDLDEKIEYYLNNPDKREEKIQNGMKLVRTKHTFTARAQKFDEIFKRLLVEKRGDF